MTETERADSMTNGELLTACQQLLGDCPTDNPNRSAIEALTDRMEAVPRDQQDQPADEANVTEFQRLQKALENKPRDLKPWVIGGCVVGAIALIIAIIALLVGGNAGNKAGVAHARANEVEQTLGDSIANVAKRTNDSIHNLRTDLVNGFAKVNARVDTIGGLINGFARYDDSGKFVESVPGLARVAADQDRRLGEVEVRLTNTETGIRVLGDTVHQVREEVRAGFQRSDSTLKSLGGEIRSGFQRSDSLRSLQTQSVAPGAPGQVASGTSPTVVSGKGAPAPVETVRVVQSTSAYEPAPAPRASGTQRSSSPSSSRSSKASAPAPAVAAPVETPRKVSVTLINDRDQTIEVAIPGILERRRFGRGTTIILDSFRAGTVYTAYVYTVTTRGSILLKEHSFKPEETSGLVRL